MLRIVIDQIEAHPLDGSITVRFRKQFVDGDTVIDLGYHRSGVMAPGDDVDAHMAVLNKHFADGVEGMKFPPVHVGEIKAIAALMHTPERIAARKKPE